MRFLKESYSLEEYTLTELAVLGNGNWDNPRLK